MFDGAPLPRGMLVSVSPIWESLPPAAHEFAENQMKKKMEMTRLLGFYSGSSGLCIGVCRELAKGVEPTTSFSVQGY